MPRDAFHVADDVHPHAVVASQTVETGLADKRVLVTGGSGGIGAACAREFAAEGAHVFVHCHRGRERAEAVAAEIGGEVVQADLTDEAQVDAAVRARAGRSTCARRSRACGRAATCPCGSSRSSAGSGRCART